MLKGAFVGLRAIERADLGQLLEWRNTPQMRRFFREGRELGSDQQLRWYEQTVLDDPCVRMFAIVELGTERLLGACGLCYIDWPNRNADVSIYIGADGLYLDEKFAPDAAKVMARYGFEEMSLHRLWAEIYDFDEARKKLFEALGFTLDGRHRQTHWTEFAWHDSLFYGLLEAEYALRRVRWVQG
jgi:RimJ/RimL family protein N-acetyltransferase